MSFYVSTAIYFLLHCDRFVALPRHKFVTGQELHYCSWPSLATPRIYIVERMRISYFLALSRVAKFYATTEQKLINSFCNALRIRRKTNQLHQSSYYTSSIYYTTQNNPWICRYRFNGKVFLIFYISPLIHVK